MYTNTLRKKMEDRAVHLLCLTASSGVPLYCRSRGTSQKQLPFPVIGSLNGVHMFGSNQDVLLTTTCTENARVAWRVFHSSITLIVLTSDDCASDLYLGRLLENVFNAMVLVVGLDDLINIKNVERLKRDLRASYQLIDSFLEVSEMVGDLVQCVDCVLSNNNGVLQSCLDAFTQAAESQFGCLLVRGKVVVATEKWWRLSAQEVMLLAWLVASLAPCSSRDYPIYLPQGSPTVPHRFLSFQLLPGVDVCVLCGPTPSLQEVENELVERFWKPLLEPLKDCLRIQARAFPGCISLHQGIMGLLLINREQKKSLYTVQPHAGEARPAPEMEASSVCLSTEQRQSVLRSFYTLAVSRYFVSEDGEDKSTVSTQEEFQAGFSHRGKECYVVSSDHKCYGIQHEQHQLFLLFKPEVPTFALRNITTKTLVVFTKELPFC
ncbi:protein fuzzy homolog isoform X2 [Latimeria chalumnae]|uniref:protein fuzzy homolog isoform X2 n=1 Tax=Latimeria chalumnae TaxID=7897 RepID=UPI0003C197F6